MTLKQYIIKQLIEIKQVMERTMNGLKNEDLTSHEPCNHWPIAWNIQHCCGGIDLLLYKHITGGLFLEHDVDRIAYPFKFEPKPNDSYPPLTELETRWTSLMDSTINAILKLEDEEFDESLINKCYTAISHTNLHLRGIWCILGERRVDEKWPIEDTCML
ncbi:MAG: DinB family protein [Clostridia bacterium]|nr:DinB family protein [Clostridia bacterium]